MLNIGRQLDRIHKITRDKAPDLAGRQFLDLVEVELPTLDIRGYCSTGPEPGLKEGKQRRSQWSSQNFPYFLLLDCGCTTMD